MAIRAERALPTPRGEVLEIGCGPLGGFVPMLLREGHHAVGIDPEAPQGQGYHRTEFEQYEPPTLVDVVVACTSLHHVADLGEVLDTVSATLMPGGSLIVVEWASEQFDQPTARWFFDRLGAPEADDDEPGWLHRHRDEWEASDRPWDAYCQAWTQQEGLHGSQDILRELDSRFDRRVCTYGPYFFSDLADTTMADEQAAIEAKQVRATGIQYAAWRR